MRTHSQPHHVHVPVLHLYHSPHVEWREVLHPIRAALFTAVLAVSIGVAGLLFESGQQAYARVTAPPPPMIEFEKRPMDREWLYSKPAVDTSAMYRRGTKAPSLDHMWRKR